MEYNRGKKLFGLPLEEMEALSRNAKGADWDGVVLERDILRLEEELGAYVGAPYCLGVDSASTGFALALAASGVQAGEEVFCPALDCLEGRRGIARAGGRPRPVDINPNTLNLDAACLEFAIKKCMRQREPVPRAVIASDAFGLPCSYEALELVCDKYGVALIEDMTQSFGASIGERRAGSFGRFAVTSFARSAPLRGLEGGGAVFCRSGGDNGALESYRSGKSPQQLGVKDTQKVQAGADGLEERFQDYHEELESRRETAAKYGRILGDAVKTQHISLGYFSTYAQYIVITPNHRSRWRVEQKLRENHIPFRTPQMNNGRNLPVNAVMITDRMLALPIHPFLSKHVVDFIGQCILDGVEEAVRMQEEELQVQAL